MIVINNKNYKNIVQNITYGKYNVSQNGKKREGFAPFVSFKCDDIYVGLEMTYDIKWIEELKVNTIVDITKFISDITFEDENGWMSLILGEYTCLLSKIGNDEIGIDLKCKGEECDTYLDISIKEKIGLKYEELSG